MAEQLRTAFRVDRAEVLLADYQLAELLPVLRPGDPVPLSTGAPARCFTTQQPVIAPTGSSPGATLHLPVTVRGDRLGVLCVDLPAVDEDVENDLAAVADALAQLLLAADAPTDRYRRLRRVRRLTLAAEMQWELLPGRCYAGPGLDFAGQLEPAYAVRGDNFDWSSNIDDFTVTVTNGMGEGVHAAILTGLAITALRNARRAGLTLADQAALADQAVYSEFRGESHLSTLLLRLDVKTGRASAVDAGSPTVLRVNKDRFELVELRRQAPLGMYDGTDYTEQQLELSPGDRLIIISDGISEFETSDGARYVDRPLSQVIRRTNAMTPLDTVRTIIGDLLTHLGGRPLNDDAVVTCLDWHGPV